MLKSTNSTKLTLTVKPCGYSSVGLKRVSRGVIQIDVSRNHRDDIARLEDHLLAERLVGGLSLLVQLGGHLEHHLELARKGAEHSLKNAPRRSVDLYGIADVRRRCVHKRRVVVNAFRRHSSNSLGPGESRLEDLLDRKIFGSNRTIRTIVCLNRLT